MRHGYLRHKPPVGFAHRGGAHSHPENTEKAFRHAVELGFRYIETDVHVTRDGVVVAFHDSRLDRVTNERGAIADVSWEVVARARVGGTEPILTLHQLLELFPDVHVNIDPKSDAVVDGLVTVLQGRTDLDRICVTAFSRRRAWRVKRRVGDDLATGGALSAALATVLAGFGLPMMRPRYEVLQVPLAFGPVPVVTRRFVRAAHRRGLHVHVWTINDRDAMEALLDLGVDGIMTDVPELLRDVMQQRNVW